MKSKKKRMGKMTKNLVLIVALFCLSLCAGIKLCAADTRPCADDISKFCKDVKPGGGRIASCLKEHEKDLSPTCKTRTEETMIRAKEIHKACADDIDKFCSDAQPGKGNMARCLKKHRAELSPECREEQRKIQRKMD